MKIYNVYVHQKNSKMLVEFKTLDQKIIFAYEGDNTLPGFIRAIRNFYASGLFQGVEAEENILSLLDSELLDAFDKLSTIFSIQMKSTNNLFPTLPSLLNSKSVSSSRVIDRRQIYPQYSLDDNGGSCCL